MSSFFAIESRIVKYLKDRHLEGFNEGLSLATIRKIFNTRLDSNICNWLEGEALVSNPNIDVITSTKSKVNLYKHKCSISTTVKK